MKKCKGKEAASYCVCLKSITLCLSPSSSSASVTFFQEYQEFGAKKYFIDHRTANTIQLFVIIKSNFSGLFFFWTILNEPKFPKDYLINVATYLFADH